MLWRSDNQGSALDSNRMWKSGKPTGSQVYRDEERRNVEVEVEEEDYYSRRWQ